MDTLNRIKFAKAIVKKSESDSRIIFNKLSTAPESEKKLGFQIMLLCMQLIDIKRDNRLDFRNISDLIYVEFSNDFNLRYPFLRDKIPNFMDPEEFLQFRFNIFFNEYAKPNSSSLFGIESYYYFFCKPFAIIDMNNETTAYEITFLFARARIEAEDFVSHLLEEISEFVEEEINQLIKNDG